MFPRRLNQGIPIAAPQSATPADGSGGSFLSVEIFCAVNVSNSAIAMRDRAARTQGVRGSVIHAISGPFSGPIETH